MKFQKKLAILGSSILLGFSASASASVIDMFDVSQTGIQDTSIDGTFEFSSVSTGLANEIIGNNRDIGVSLEENLSSSLFPTSIGVAGGFLSFNSASGVKAIGVVQWDGANSDLSLDTTGLGGVDITDGGNLSLFRVETNNSDLGFTFTITIWDMAGEYVTVGLASHEVAPFQDPGQISYLGLNTWDTCDATGVGFIDCSTPAIGVDLTSVGAIELIINPLGAGGQADIDLSLSSITTVPEPSSLGLLGAGLFASGFAANRKKNKKA